METTSRTRGHETTPLKAKGDIEDVSSELDDGVKSCTSWMKRPKVAESSRSQISDQSLKVGLSPGPTENLPCIEKLMPFKSTEAQSHLIERDVEVWRGVYQLKFCSSHLTTIQNYVHR
ncbi:hypothetical protein TNCV_971441 [Trichonephila clavipes]|nr:hypothetical protein TNCV_971441 [Trichonephila clavipes]